MAKVFRAPASKQVLEEQARAAARIQAIAAPPKIDWVSGGAGSDVTFTLSGYTSLLENIDTMEKIYKDAAGEAVQELLSEIAAEAKIQVPVLNYRLQDSIDYDRYDPENPSPIVDMSVWAGAPNPAVYGDSSSRVFVSPEQLQALRSGDIKVMVDPSVYALIQHEDLTFNHPRGGKAKYLEDPFNQFMPQVVDRINAAIEAEMRTVFGENPAFVEFIK